MCLSDWVNDSVIHTVIHCKLRPEAQYNSWASSIWYNRLCCLARLETEEIVEHRARVTTERKYSGNIAMEAIRILKTADDRGRGVAREQ
jgi:hypothetical protein